MTWAESINPPISNLSVDHLEYLSERDIVALKDADTVAVILPGAFYFLNETQKPPIQSLRKYQFHMAAGMISTG